MKSLSWPVKFAAILSIVLPTLWFAEVFVGLENSWQDELARKYGDALQPGDERLIVAAMDDAALQKWGLPPSREMHVKAVEALTKLGAHTIAFDIMFLESRPFDAELAAACKRHGRCIQLYHLAGEEQGDPHLQPPVALLKNSAAMLAHPSIARAIDSDGHLRRLFMFDERVDNPVTKGPGMPLLGAAAYSSLSGVPMDEALKTYAENGNMRKPRLMNLRFRQPRVWEHESFKKGSFGSWTPYRYIPINDIIAGKLTAEQKKAIKGAVIFPASTATAYFDHYPTPFSTSVPGVETHLLAADNALHGDWLRIVSRPLALLIILAMIWLPLPLARFPPMGAAGAALGLLIVYYVATGAMFASGLYVDFVAPIVALLISFLGQTVHRVLAEGQEKKFIKGLFGQFVAPEVVEDLAKDPSKVKLGGEKKDLTMFFLDIAHFTDISEKMPPEKLIVFLNKYLSALTHVVHENKGVVDKYIGDCVMAFWNAPMPNPDHRLLACLSAIQCQEVMEKLNAKLQPDEVPIVPAIRIGLNSGFATVGLTGSDKKLQYTVIGDEVNLASRLEGANKFFGSKIMASEATYSGAKERIEARELGPVRVVGKQKPILVYELLGEKGKLSDQWQKALPHYNRGLELFKAQKYAEAVTAFQEVIKIFPEDGPANLYLNTSKDYSVLPPDVHPVVFNLTAK